MTWKVSKGRKTPTAFLFYNVLEISQNVDRTTKHFPHRETGNPISENSRRSVLTFIWKRMGNLCLPSKSWNQNSYYNYFIVLHIILISFLFSLTWYDFLIKVINYKNRCMYKNTCFHIRFAIFALFSYPSHLKLSKLYSSKICLLCSLKQNYNVQNNFRAFCHLWLTIWFFSKNEPAHEIIVLITKATNEGSASMRIRAVLPEPSLLAHMKYGSRRRVCPKVRHLAPLVGCACAFEERVYGGRKVP